MDYCPPVDVNFGDYLRAIITADTDLIPDDDRGYRIAFIEAFRRRGIYPRDIRTLSVESLCWSNIREEQQQGIFKVITNRLRFFVQQLSYLDDFPQLEGIQGLEGDPGYIDYLKKILIADKEQKWDALDGVQKDKIWQQLFEVAAPKKPWSALSPSEKINGEKVLWQTISEREKIFSLTRTAQGALHKWLADYKVLADPDQVAKFEALTGLYFLETSEKQPKVMGLEVQARKYTFEVHSFRGARRVGPDGNTVNEVIISLTQKRSVTLEETPANPDQAEKFDFRGGCTLILDLQTLKLKYVVKKLIDNRDGRLTRQRAYRTGEAGASLRATYFGRPEQNKNSEPFALLHSDL